MSRNSSQSEGSSSPARPSGNGAGQRHYLWRVVDQDGDLIDTLVQRKRNARVAKRFFRKLLKGQANTPWWLVTDKLKNHGAAHRIAIGICFPPCQVCRPETNLSRVAVALARSHMSSRSPRKGGFRLTTGEVSGTQGTDWRTWPTQPPPQLRTPGVFDVDLWHSCARCRLPASRRCALASA